MMLVFLVTETKKAVPRMLKASGHDTDDREAAIFDYIDSLESRIKHLELNAQPLLPSKSEGNPRVQIAWDVLKEEGCLMYLLDFIVK